MGAGSPLTILRELPAGLLLRPELLRLRHLAPEAHPLRFHLKLRDLPSLALTTVAATAPAASTTLPAVAVDLLTRARAATAALARLVPMTIRSRSS